MIIACPACVTRYVVPDTAIGVDGRTVRCAKCRHSWFQDGPVIAVPAPPAPSPPPPPPPPPPPAAQPGVVAEPAPAVSPDPGDATFADEADAPAPAESSPWPPAEPAAVNETAPTEGPPWPPAAEHAPGPFTQPAPVSFAEAPLPSSPSAAPLSADGYVSGEGYSRFAHEPLFRARRNPAKMWTIAAALFAVVTLGSIAATWWYGMPSWMPFAHPLFAEAQPGLKLEFPDKQQGQRQLPDNSWFFEANGAVTNLSQSARSVPAILVVLKDARGRIVYSAEIRSPKRVLAPGESVAINEALVPVPKAAVRAEFGWKPGS